MLSSGAKKTVHSAVWAAYGDALGFISERTDERGLKKRIGSVTVSNTVAWRRVIGGMYGPSVELPAGCYSDDTQLRLATCRAIRGSGYFDVESFAKIELPVWLSYSLGAGVGVKAAATSLTAAGVNWFSNFYSGKGRSYMESGGNGAAMRIQPHVWAAKDKASTSDYLLDVIRNAICTHGNLHGLLGAVFHAETLALTFALGMVPGPLVWRECVNAFGALSKLIDDDSDIRTFWLPVWEQKSGMSLREGLKACISECLRDIELIEAHEVFDARSFAQLVASVGGLDPETKGSGIKTALLAASVAWSFRNRPPEQGIIAASNVLGSDTDTIATMVGALAGVHSQEAPAGPVCDCEYITSEAVRLYEISIGQDSASFQYPDLARWTAPKTHAGMVGLLEGKLTVAGLGNATPLSDAFGGKDSEGNAWRWLQLDFGQAVLAKIRSTLPNLTGSHVAQTVTVKEVAQKVTRIAEKKQVQKAPQISLFPEAQVVSESSRGWRSIEELTAEAMRGPLDAETIGRHILELSAREDGIELCIAYVAIIGKTRMARLKRHERNPVADSLEN